MPRIGRVVLTRREGESVRIGDNIVVIVSQADRHKAKLCIEAPVDVKILRTELEEYEEERR